MLGRMLGAARLNAGTFEDVEHGPRRHLAGAGGGDHRGHRHRHRRPLRSETDILQGLGFGVVRGVLFWALWALGTWVVGSTILRTSATNADWGQLARGTGFAQTPGILNIFIFLPGVGGLFGLGALLWQLVAMMVAVRQSLDYNSTWRAFFVVLIAVIPVAIVYGIITALLGIGVPVTPEGS